MNHEQGNNNAQVIEIKIPARPRYLKILRAAIGSLCEISGFCTDELNNIILAIDEACSNIIKHTYGGPSDNLILARIFIFPERMEVRLRDYGKKIDIEKIKPRKLTEVRPGGLGVHFIKTVMDEVKYENHFDVGNQVTLIKYLKGK